MRRETISVYMNCGVPCGERRRHDGAAASLEDGVITEPACAKPASQSDEVSTDSGGESATLGGGKT